MARAADGTVEAQIVFRLPVELREELEATAAQNDRTLSQELRRAIRWYVSIQRQGQA